MISAGSPSPKGIARSFFSLGKIPLPLFGRDAELEKTARELLGRARQLAVARTVRVEWNVAPAQLCRPRQYTWFHRFSLNPRLREHGPDEIDRTLRHELAHLLAIFARGVAASRRMARNGDRPALILASLTNPVVIIFRSRLPAGRGHTSIAVPIVIPISGGHAALAGPSRASRVVASTWRGLRRAFSADADHEGRKKDIASHAYAVLLRG